MIRAEPTFEVSCHDLLRDVDRQLRDQIDFRLDGDRVAEYLVGNLSVPRRDLLRIAMAIYTSDRLVRRSRDGRSGRRVRLEIEVTDPGPWQSRRDALDEILSRVSNDSWYFDFAKAPARQVPAALLEASDTPVVCLYSGGLDSAGGLAARLSSGVRSVITVTARHQPGQRRQILAQLELFRRRFGARITPLFVRTTLLRPPRISYQETSQRTRSLLFLALGAAAADVAGVPSVELYESGVGALNLPLMAGMIIGARTTRSCEPQFLELVGALASIGTPQAVTFSLPFIRSTKAEVVRSLKDCGLQEVVPLTNSCIHYPLRERGLAKQCGVCPACIGRRQALAGADVYDSATQYKYDIFDPRAVIPLNDLQYLHANLFQVARLGELGDSAEPPSCFSRHLRSAGLAGTDQDLAYWTGLMHRYRNEWLTLVAACGSRNVPWARLLSTVHRVAS